MYDQKTSNAESSSLLFAFILFVICVGIACTQDNGDFMGSEVVSLLP